MDPLTPIKSPGFLPVRGVLCDCHYSVLTFHKAA